MKRFIIIISSVPLCIAALLMFRAPSFGASPEPVHVAVLQFRESGTSASHAALVGNYLEMELLQKKEIVLLERGQIKKKYTVREANRYSCQDSSCAVLAGRALSADYVILGDVVRNGNFSIRARVVSVAMEKIVYSCSVQYDGEDGARSAAGELVKKLMIGFAGPASESQPPADDAGTLPAKPVFVDLHARLAVFQPFDKLNGLIGTGAGFTCGIMVSGMAKNGREAVRRITAGFDAAVLYAPGVINTEDSGMLVPFSFSLGYMVPVIERIYFIPVVSLGFTYIRFHHAEGDGFDMEDGTTAWDVDPHFRVMLLFGRPLVKNIRLELSTAFWVLIESPHAPFFLTVHLGLTCRFDAK